MSINNDPTTQTALYIDKLPYNAVSATTQRGRHICSGGVPRVRNGVVLPRLVTHITSSVDETTDNIDLTVAPIVECVRKKAGSRHRRTRAPGVRRDVVDLRRAQQIVGSVKPAEDVNLVNVGRIRDSSGVFGSRYKGQRRPGVCHGIISVKSIGRRRGSTACRISERAIAGDGRGL